MRRRVLKVLVVVLMAASTAAYGGLQKRVSVVVEGREVALRTFAFTVGDALDRAGVSLGPNDRVVPDVSTRLGEGQTIEVYRAKRITILLDGKPKRIVVTSLTVAEVLEEIDVRASLADYVHPSRSAPVERGMTLTYRSAVSLTVTADGEAEEIITNAATVGEVLKDLEIDLGKRDRVSPGLDRRPAEGMTIRVQRVGDRVETVTRSIPFETVRKKDRTLEYGQTRVAQKGREGVRRLTYKATYVDGKRVSRTLVSSTVVRKPRDKVIAVGSYFPACRCTHGSQTGGASWYAQADGLTAAHKTLPKGTVVKVTNLSNGRTVTVVIRDRGPYIKGRIIDLSDEAFRRIAPLSSGVARVKITW